MELAAELAAAGHQPERISTVAKVHIDKVGEDFEITRIELLTEGTVPGIDQATFSQIADSAKHNCPVSKALAAVKDITLQATLR